MMKLWLRFGFINFVSPLEENNSLYQDTAHFLTWRIAGLGAQGSGGQGGGWCGGWGGEAGSQSVSRATVEEKVAAAGREKLKKRGQRGE